MNHLQDPQNLNLKKIESKPILLLVGKYISKRMRHEVGGKHRHEESPNILIISL